MADWPDADELKQVLDLNDDPDNWTVTIDRILSAAIARVKLDVGVWDELVDEPDEALAQAALRMGELIAERPAASQSGTDDPTYWRLMYGHRRRFAVS
jgi:hypothetical protein